MEERYGAKGTIQDGVFFTEGSIANARVLKRVRIEISRQNATLGDVKARMAAEVRDCGGTALSGFVYGQRKHHWTQMLAFKWDTESWYGEGDAVSI